MVEYVAYYDEHGEKYVCTFIDYINRRKKLPPGKKWNYPDEVKLLGMPLIKREKTREELSKEGLVKVYRQYTPFAAKDITLDYAMKCVETY